MVPRTFGDLSSSPAEKNAQCAGRFRSNFNPSEELFTQPKHLHQLFSKLSALSHERTHALYSGFMEGGVSALSGWRRLFTVFFFSPRFPPFHPPTPAKCGQPRITAKNVTEPEGFAAWDPSSWDIYKYYKAEHLSEDV